ncbi:MAG TPA: ABC transporter substrate-binding protein [Thermoanaerobaculia bacterium]|nr:ABC transporter substrate-binding protein [Thermoanaerobaculia bacterium]
MSRTRRVVSAIPAVALAGLLLTGCPGDQPALVGAVLPLSGEFALYGEPIRKGIELAAEQVQANEELGFRVVLEVADSESSPEKAAELARDFYRREAAAVIGGVTTGEAREMVPAADEAGRVLLSPSASSPLLTGVSRYFYRVYPSDFREGTKMGIFAAQTLGIETLAILAAESPYARGIQDVFQTEYERFDGQVVANVEYPQGTEDFGELVEQALAEDPEAVYVADYARPTSRIVSAIRERDSEVRILTTSAYASPGVIAEAGEDAEGVLLTQTALPPDDPNMKAFSDAYEAKYGEAPDVWAAHGYDSFMVLIEAMKEAGARPRDIWEGLRAVRNFQGATGVIQFNEQGDVGKYPRTYLIEGGKLVDFEMNLEQRKREYQRRLDELNRRAGRTTP